MILDEQGITADAVALQERDEFREAGWLKLLAPAKVNLFLGIGAKRTDGYHDVSTVMHALTLHDVLYVHKKLPLDDTYGSNVPDIQLVPTGGFPLPEIAASENLAVKAVCALQKKLAVSPDFRDIKIRIAKNIPPQGGLGGASTDAAAALVGAALLHEIALDEPAIEQTARDLGADVAFFLYGGCSYFEGVGDIFHHALEPARTPLVLIKPDEGVSTPLAYRTFDEDPLVIDAALLDAAQSAQRAEDVPLFNNLAPAAEKLLPLLQTIRMWVGSQQGVTNALLCGSGATTFALCDSMDTALRIVAEAKKRGYWARSTSLSTIGVRALSVNG